MGTTCGGCGEAYAIFPSRLRSINYCSITCKSEAKARDTEHRFWTKVKKTETCWIWAGATSNGHGVFRPSRSRQNVRAHRFIWELVNGRIPNGKFVCHHCDNRPCVRPDHLFLGSHQDNMTDMTTKNRQALGERNGRAKLNAKIIEYVRSRAGIHKHSELAQELGVSIATIRHIVNRRIWRHLP